MYLQHIQSQIKQKKQLLLKKRYDLEKKNKENEFLSVVKDDYQRYYQHILKQKKQQYESLLLLKEYMNDLMATEQLVDNQLENAKGDYKDILAEIDKVKSELDEMV